MHTSRVTAAFNQVDKIYSTASDSWSVTTTIIGVDRIIFTDDKVAAVLEDMNVVMWGDMHFSSDSSSVKTAFIGVDKIDSTNSAFAQC